MSQDRRPSHDYAEAIWRVSSYSGGQGECVEVADNLPGVGPVRDSKCSGGPSLAFSPRAWGVFVGHLR
jgi:hypothetical protein